MLRAGDSDERVPFLRRRLMATGELAKSASTAITHSTRASKGCGFVHYQELNGLRATGRVDKPTLAALNVPADQRRLAQLKLNHGRLLELVRSPPRGSATCWSTCRHSAGSC